MVERDEEDSAVAAGRDASGATSTSGSTPRVAAAVPVADVQGYIGRQLRAVYDDVAKQPIPDRFVALMQQLEAKGAR